MRAHGHLSGLKACLFDFGGTLDADGIAWQETFYRLYRKHGLDPSREQFRQAFYAADDSLTASGELSGSGFQETVERQVAGVFDVLGLSSSGTLRKAVAEDFVASARSHIRRNRPVLEVLAQQYRLGIVSNFYGNLTRVCGDLGIREFFGCIVDSNLEGVVKPDPRIFQAALDSLGVEPSRSVFVGDNLCRDMMGAKQVGMPHIWLAGPGWAKAVTCCPQDPVIGCFLEVKRLLISDTQQLNCGGTPRHSDHGGT